MGKISPVSAKYIVHAQIQIDGVVERPDVIGSVFGQTEGLLGADLELRELQRNGRIGRIEVEINTQSGKTVGSIIIPTSMDKTETVLIAASLETIQRIGPCNARVKVEKVEDVRVTKRIQVIERAKELLSILQTTVLPESRMIKDQVVSSVKTMEITEYGRERLPAGPMVEESDDIIIVEGRADVLTLLRNDIKNAIAINGTSVPQTIIELCRRKTVTVFVDGDRGGDLIIKELSILAEIDYVCKAPDGKEVEELSQKEILKSLRGKVAMEQVKYEINGTRKEDQPVQRPEIRNDTRRFERPMMRPVNNMERRPQFRPVQSQPLQQRPAPTQRKQALTKEIAESYKNILEDLIGTRGACLLDGNMNILGKVPLSELPATITSLDTVNTIIFDGNITRDLLAIAEKSNVRNLVGMENESGNAGTAINLITSSELYN